MNIRNFVRVIAAALIGVASSAQEAVIERGPHHELRTIVTGEGEGAVTNSFTVLQSGIGYWAEETKSWEASSDQIEIIESGARHIRGPIKVSFPPNYNDPANPLVITLPDGRTLKLKTAGLAITDRTNGDTELIATVRQAGGFLSNDGRSVIYRDAFQGGVSASIKVSVGIGRVRHDVVLHTDIEVPAGMNIANCDLEVLHEFLEETAFVPKERTIDRASGESQSDLHLDFGEARIGPGTAFLIGNSETPVTDGQKPIRVRKEIFTDPVSNKRFLIEGVPLTEASQHLQTLGRREARSEPTAPIGGIRAVADGLKGRRLPKGLVQSSTAPGIGLRQVAAIRRMERPEEPGFTVDFTVLSTTANLRLAGNTTYKVTGDVSVSTSLVIEGGTVVKYPSGSTGVISSYGTTTCETDLFSPATFTAIDDHSIGEVMSTNNPSGYYGLVYLDCESAATLSHLRFRYGNCGLYNYNASIDVTDVQAVKCYWGIFTDASSTAATVRNYLASETQFPVAYGRNSSVIRGEHFTINRANKVADRQTYTGCELTLTNSLLSQITNATSSLTITTNMVYTEASSIFASAVAGEHYLAGSTLRDVGVTNLTAGMLSLLRKTTTYAPTTFSNQTVSVNTVLLPQVPRDIVLPDIGYHYGALDYVFARLSVTNATLTLQGGVNVGLVYDYGILNVDGSTVVSQGRPNAPNRFVDYSFVQEQPIRLTNGVATWPTIYPYHYGSTTTSFRSRFTEFIGHRTHIYQANSFRISSATVEDCTFKLGSVSITHTSGTPTGLFRNNLWERSSLQVTANSDFSFYNNLFYRTGVNAENATLNSLTFKDNAFHYQGADNLDDVINDYNAYIDTSARLYPNGANDVILGSFNYATGTFGKYYHSSTTLLNEGSRNANTAGLYHYTVQTSETKDASVVDVGFHYVAAAGGVPVDTDGDGIPDYLEDADGDGSVDTGETSPSVSNTGGSGTVGLILFTLLR